MDGYGWLFPWTYLDTLLRIELVLWVLAVVAAISIWAWSIVLGKTWLALGHMDRTTDSESGEGDEPR